MTDYQRQLAPKTCCNAENSVVVKVAILPGSTPSKQVRAMSIDTAVMVGLVGTFCAFVTLGLIAKLQQRRMMDVGETAVQTPGERAPVPLVWMQSVY